MATYAYLIDPNKQYITKSGTINTAGILRVYDASTDDPVITYNDFMGTENEEAIVLDNNGRAIVIADSDKAYRLEVYDRYNTLQWTVTPLWCQAGGGGASIARTDIVSSDGTVEITKTTVGSTTTFDLSTDVEDSTDLLEWIRCEGNEIHDGVYVPLYVGGTMEVLDDGIGMYADRYYHVTAHIKCNKPVTLQPFYDDVKVHFVGRDIDDPTDEFTFQSFKLDVDYTMAMPQVFEVSTDIISLNDFELLIKIDDVEISGATFEVSDISVHRVFSGMPALPGGAASKPWAEEKFQPILTPGTGITIDEDNVISATAAQQVNSDWDATSGVSEILNKPDLTVYATKEEVAEDLDEKQDVLTAGDNIVIENNVISATAAPQVNADWDSNSGVSEILHKPDLSVYATKSEVAQDLADKQDVLTAGDNIVIEGNVISATAAPQVNADWEANSGPAEILHKPDLSIYATQSDLADKQDTLIPGEGITIVNNVISAEGGSFTQVNSDWDATSGVEEILNKPDLSIYAEKSELSTVATTGDYDDLLNKPTITQPVNADWDSNSGLSQILNKPDLSQYATQSDLDDKQDVLTAGANITIENNVISAAAAAQVNSDWDATSGVSEILNKPDLSIYAEKSELATVATTGDYDDLLNKPTITQPVNADWNSSTGLSEILNKPDLSIYAEKSDLATVATSGSYNDLTDKPTIVTPVNADWNSNAGLSKILNKPTLATVATTGSYNDLTDKPSIVGQVNSDWLATSGVEEILNKPNEIALVAGQNITLTKEGNELTISAQGGGGAPQVNSDWDATSGVAMILNKPAEANVIAGDNITITESGSTITISATAAPQQNADWNATSGVQEILNKPTIPSGTQLVPAATSADADKVLTVDAQGTPAWASAQAPISAGTGIDITNNVVSVDTSVVATQTDLADKEDAFDVGTGLEMDTSGATPTLQVEAPVDIVAGPGIVVDNPDGNTLRVSVAQDYNKVLWSGIAATSANVSESIFNFERCRMVIQENDATNTVAECEFEIVPGTTTYDVIALYYGGSSNPFQMETAPVTITNDGTTVSIGTVIRRYFPASTGAGGSDSNTGKMTKVVGIHRIANN